MNEYTFRIYNHREYRRQNYSILAPTIQQARQQLEAQTRGITGTLINVRYRCGETQTRHLRVR